MDAFEKWLDDEIEIETNNAKSSEYLASEARKIKEIYGAFKRGEKL